MYAYEEVLALLLNIRLSLKTCQGQKVKWVSVAERERLITLIQGFLRRSEGHQHLPCHTHSSGQSLKAFTHWRDYTESARRQDTQHNDTQHNGN
jgi:hypothetical protein